MNLVVIDTNVVLAANSQHEDLSEKCNLECAKRLEEVMRSGIVVLDNGYEIIKEYQKKTNHRGAKRMGDVFVKWLLQNLSNTGRCSQVALASTGADNSYVGFPDQSLHDDFDPPDRKFIVVAHSHGESPKILQAADCKWLNWNDRLKAVGVSVEFICPEDICRFYQSKFPGIPVPDL